MTEQEKLEDRVRQLYDENQRLAAKAETYRRAYVQRTWDEYDSQKPIQMAAE